MAKRGWHLTTSVAMALLMIATLVAPALASAEPVVGGVEVPSAVVSGSGSCTGTEACTGATGPIGDNSCNGDFACSNSTAAIGNDSCNGGLACNQASSVGDGSCNGVQACNFASASIGNYSCNGDYNCQNRHVAAGDCTANDSVPPECLQPDARIRRIGRGNLVGNDIYNIDAAGQTLATHVPIGTSRRRFVITIQNDGAVPDSFVIGGSSSPTAARVDGQPLPVNIVVKFYHGWPAQDITDDIYGGGYTTPTIAPGGVFRIRMVVDAQVGVTEAAGPALSFAAKILVPVASATDASRHDAVAVNITGDLPT